MTTPTLLIVGGNDWNVLDLNDQAATLLSGPRELAIVPGAGHLFEEPGTLEQVADLAGRWFVRHLARQPARGRGRRDRRDGRHDMSTPLQALRAEARPLTGAPGRLRRAARADRRRALRAARRGVPRHARVLPRARADHQAADRGEGLHRRRGRGRLARRLPRQPLRARRGATTGRRARRWPGFQRFPTWMWRNADVLDFVGWLRAHNDAPADGGQGRLLRPRPLQPARARSRRCSATSTRSTPRPPSARARATRCFEHFGEDAQAYGYAAGFGLIGVLRARGGQPARRAAAQRRRLRRARRARRRGRVLLRRAERAAGARTPRSTTARCSDGREPSWNLRDRHMADTLDGLLAHLERHGGGTQGRRLGAQLASRRRARHRDGRDAAS